MNNGLKAGFAIAGISAGASVASVAAIKATGKIAGKPIGIPGSSAHILTNDKLDCAQFGKDYAKEQGKNLAKTAGFAGALATGAAVAAKFSSKVSDAMSNANGKVKQTLDEMAQVAEEKVSAETIKNFKPIKKFNSLPKPAQAAIIVGAAALAIAAPILAIKSGADAAYLEAKNETK